MQILHNRLFALILALVCGLAVFGCKDWAKPIPIPAYLHIPAIKVETQYALQGTASSRITDVWCYQNSRLLGVFELPATIPIPNPSAGPIALRAGIFRDGLSETRAEYIYYKTYNVTKELAPQRTDTVSPTVFYEGFTKFDWLEDFDNLGVTVRNGAGSDTSFVLVSDTNKFEGLNSLAMFLELPRASARIESGSSFELDRTGRQVFLEVNFKTDYSVTFGLQVESPGSGNILIDRFTSFDTKGQWRKVYLFLNPIITGAPTDARFRVVAHTRLTNGATKASVYIDNFKIVSYR